MNDRGINSKLFVLGIALGVAGGLIVGSVIGMQLGEKSVGYFKANLNKLAKSKPSVRFDLLLQ